MHTESLFTWTTVFGFLFTLARISGVFAFLPLAAFRAGPEPARAMLALAFTVLLWPQWSSTAGADASLGRIVTGLASEAGLGLAIGLAMAIVLEVFQMAAQVLSLQAGFGYASMVDPATGADSTVLITLAQMSAGLYFFTSGADRFLVRALADSLRLLPPESFKLQPGWTTAMVAMAAQIFSVGLRLAMPVVAILLLVDASLAVMGRIQGQLQLVSLTIPVKLAATMLLLSLIIGFQPHTFETLYANAIRLIESMLRSVPGR